jgi:hypothetical protein
MNEHGHGYEQPTEPLSLPLYPPGPAIAGDVPTKRAVWRIMLTAVLGTVAGVALLLGGYVLYHDQATEISRLKEQRQELKATNGTLRTQLATTQTKLGRATRGLTTAKKNLTKQRTALAAANRRATANYNAGYNQGNNAGYSSGQSAGLIQGSDQLTCSDDPDVNWLPYCS